MSAAPAISQFPKLRPFWDRARQVTLYEAGGLLLIAPPFAGANGFLLGDSFNLLAFLALISLSWNAAYNTALDWAEGYFTARTADRRAYRLRVVQAFGLEASQVLITAPVIAVWTGMTWWQALAVDIGLTIAYSAYGFVFNLIYDRVFPIEPDLADRDLPPHRSGC